jgi:hypothetical protein
MNYGPLQRLGRGRHRRPVHRRARAGNRFVPRVHGAAVLALIAFASISMARPPHVAPATLASRGRLTEG